MAVALVPAAGRSRRMGRPKLLLPFGQSTVIGSLLASLRRGGVERVLLVLAPGDSALKAWATSEGIETTLNSAPERGMLSSILEGLRALTEGDVEPMREPVLVCPADLPTIRAETIGLLIESYRTSSGPLLVPAHRGRRGHPLLIGPPLLSEVAHLDPAIGLRQLLEHHPVQEIPVADPGVVRDVDTPGQYLRLLREAQGEKDGWLDEG